MQMIKHAVLGLVAKKATTKVAKLFKDENGAPGLAGQIGMAVLVIVIILALLAIFNPGFQGIANSIISKINGMN